MGGSNNEYFIEFVEKIKCKNMACTTEHAAGQSGHSQVPVVSISALVSALEGACLQKLGYRIDDYSLQLPPSPAEPQYTAPWRNKVSTTSQPTQKEHPFLKYRVTEKSHKGSREDSGNPKDPGLEAVKTSQAGFPRNSCLC